MAFTLEVSSYVLVNTEMVKETELISYRDLLNLRWKSNMVLSDPTIAGAGLRFFGVVGGRIMGLDFMKELARQEPVITKDRRLQVEWVARGKYPIGLGAESPSISEFKNAGAPIREVVPIEGSGLAAGSGCIGLINKAPHPNASKLFINWFLGQEGQTVWTKAIRKAGGSPASRS